VRTLILDFNDTIDDNFAVKKEALTHVLKKFSADDLSIKKVLVEIDKIDLAHPDWSMEDIVATALKNILGIEMEKAIKIAKNYQEYRKKHSRLDASFVKVVPKLAKKFRIVLLTSGNKENIKQLMEKYGIGKYIEKYYFTHELGMKKPSIDLLEMILKENNIDKEDCIVVGDDIIKDHMPAKLLGIKTVLYSKFVDNIISDFKELL
jgi:HAD superfamily hydrolase (TIGR01549 family)